MRLVKKTMGKSATRPPSVSRHGMDFSVIRTGDPSFGFKWYPSKKAKAQIKRQRSRDNG